MGRAMAMTMARVWCRAMNMEMAQGIEYGNSLGLWLWFRAVGMAQLWVWLWVWPMSRARAMGMAESYG